MLVDDAVDDASSDRIPTPWTFDEVVEGDVVKRLGSLRWRLSEPSSAPSLPWVTAWGVTWVTEETVGSVSFGLDRASATKFAFPWT